MALINLKQRTAAAIVERDKKLLEKANAKKATSKKGSSTILTVVENVRQDIEENLSQFSSKFDIIGDAKTLNAYIDRCNEDGVIAIDTETEGLNPITDRIAGLCLYSPSQKAVYVPINHIDYISGDRLDNQVTETAAADALKRLTAKIIMFNATFDIRVIRNQLHVFLTCYWDCMIAHKCLDENSKKNGLKDLYSRYIMPNNSGKVTFNELFGKTKITLIPPNYAYLYAAKDAEMTYELYAFQSRYLRPDFPDKSQADVYEMFMSIEMPIVNVVCDMEDFGVYLDMDVAQKLSEKYNKRHDASYDKCQDIIRTYWSDTAIADWNLHCANHGNSKKALKLPINLSSSVQMTTLLYDVLGFPEDRRKGRKADKETFEFLASKCEEMVGIKADPSEFKEFVSSYLEYKATEKILSTYVDKMPKIALNDGKIHCRYHQYGAGTGRFSSTDPNMQNIPSKNGEIRTMFTGGIDYREVEVTDDFELIFNKTEEVEVNGSYKFVEFLNIGDVLESDEGNIVIKDIMIEPTLTGKVICKVFVQ